MITRFAPTPSGFLHRGNAANALLASWLARSAGGTLALRIDDADSDRVRREYVDDIFDLLAWLEVSWQAGPVDAADLDAHWSARHRAARHRAALQRATESGLSVYACSCSRRVQAGPATGGCVGGCRHLGLPFVAGETALRVRVPVGMVVDVSGTPAALADEVGDFIVWRRDDRPAYQLASVVDDEDLGVTDVVRGADLLASSAAQLFLAPSLGAPTFAAARFRHHGLVTDPRGGKLSKSQQDNGAPLPRTDAERSAVEALARTLGMRIGITPPP